MKTYPVAFFSSNKFVHMAQNMVRSLLINNAQAQFHFNVISDELTSVDVEHYFVKEFGGDF